MQSGSQSTRFGDQTVGEQKNDADVDQYQGNTVDQSQESVQRQAFAQGAQRANKSVGRS